MNRSFDAITFISRKPTVNIFEILTIFVKKIFKDT